MQASALVASLPPPPSAIWYCGCYCARYIQHSRKWAPQIARRKVSDSTLVWKSSNKQWQKCGKVTTRILGRGSVTTQLGRHLLVENDTKSANDPIGDGRWSRGDQRTDPTVDKMMDVERYETRHRKGQFPWNNMGRVADINDFHGVIWDKGAKVQHLVDRWYSLPSPQWEYWFWLIMARSGSVNTCKSPDSYFKTRGWSRWLYKSLRMVLEHAQWTGEYLLLNCTV